MNNRTRLQIGKCIRQYSTTQGRVNRNSLAFTSSATRADKERARQRTDRATSKWRSTLRRCTVAEIAGLWTVTTQDGRQLIATPSLTDALAVAQC